MRIRPLMFAIAVVTSVAACSPTGASSPSRGPSVGAPAVGPASAPPTTLTIFAAASLKRALDRAKTLFEASHPGTALVVSTDSSAALEAQIELGAPADVFLSADTTNPQKLIDQRLAAGAAVPFASNELTIIVPAANPAGLQSAFELARSGVKIVAAADEVPITRYARHVLENLAMEPGAPPDFVAKVAANVVSREDNVRAVVAKIELGEGDAGIAYVTDAEGSAMVATVDVPARANVRATYAGVVVAASRDVAAARAFLDWLAGRDGRAILAGFGFLPPP